MYIHHCERAVSNNAEQPLLKYKDYVSLTKVWRQKYGGKRKLGKRREKKLGIEEKKKRNIMLKVS